MTLALDPSGQGFESVSARPRPTAQPSARTGRSWPSARRAWSGATGVPHAVRPLRGGDRRRRRWPGIAASVARYFVTRRAVEANDLRAPVGDRSEPLSRSATTVRRPRSWKRCTRGGSSTGIACSTSGTRAPTRASSAAAPSGRASCRSRTSNLATRRASADGPPRHHHGGSSVGPRCRPRGRPAHDGRARDRAAAQQLARRATVSAPSRLGRRPRHGRRRWAAPRGRREGRERRGSDPPVSAGP